MPIVKIDSGLCSLCLVCVCMSVFIGILYASLLETVLLLCAGKLKASKSTHSADELAI